MYRVAGSFISFFLNLTDQPKDDFLYLRLPPITPKEDTFVSYCARIN
jgi:hypothetical protein